MNGCFVNHENCMIMCVEKLLIELIGKESVKECSFLPFLHTLFLLFFTSTNSNLSQTNSISSENSIPMLASSSVKNST